MGRLPFDYKNNIIHNCLVLEPKHEHARSSKDSWKIKCHCGNVFFVTIANLQRKTKSCGCILKQKYLNNQIDYIDKIYNKCIILEPCDINKITCMDKYIVQCYCGKLFKARPNDMQQKHSNSCGCLRKETCKNTSLKNKRYIYQDFINKFGVKLLYPLHDDYVESSDLWKALCPICNNEFNTIPSTMIQSIRSCGCLKQITSRENAIKYNKKQRLLQGLKENQYLTEETDLLRKLLKDLRPLILQIDGHVCNLCFTNKNLQIHHAHSIKENFNFKDIQTYKQLYDINNIITLCKHCHIQLAHNGNARKLNLEIQKELEAIISMRMISKSIQLKYDEIVKIEIIPWIKNYIRSGE